MDYPHCSGPCASGDKPCPCPQTCLCPLPDDPEEVGVRMAIVVLIAFGIVFVIERVRAFFAPLLTCPRWALAIVGGVALLFVLIALGSAAALTFGGKL